MKTAVGGDPGCDGFESPDELASLFDELRGWNGPVELILAGDFFDFLQIGDVPEGGNRASITISRPEYREMFDALWSFREREGTRVIYLPGNHDAEVWWFPEIQRTLRERGLVDEFAFSYSASYEVGGATKVVYCEHGNQFDPENTVADYEDPLDTPLGHHVVTDFTRRVAPFGQVSWGLDLSEVKMVYPLVAIPQWIVGRYFYRLLEKIATYLLLPLLVVYLVYRLLAYTLAIYRNAPERFFESYQTLPEIHWVFAEIAGFGLLIVGISAIFFLVFRRAARKTMARMNVGGKGAGYDPAKASARKIQAILDGGESPPMSRADISEKIDIFVSGHTHLPSLSVVEEPGGGGRVLVNSGCWLRQIQPVKPIVKGPPVFVSKFVLTHARVFVRDGELRVELWEHPKPAGQHLSRLERLLSAGRRPSQPGPDSGPRVRLSHDIKC
ncbi:MAG: metallophosphoesterase [Actinomycetota bacterium]|jgi:UDP-2,3-diacylglucosamine pyrophosphatase LpxH|nr:metallophosphoesterase [Actinomycetota bacterium]